MTIKQMKAISEREIRAYIRRERSNQQYLEFYAGKVASGEQGLYTGHYAKQLAKYQRIVAKEL